MRHLIYILLTLLTGFTACQQRSIYPPAMQQAEALMNTRPDSALLLLESMADTLGMLPEETRMYHQLLTIQAKDKQYITHTGDSLINRIVDFYENHGDKDRLMMAYFYQGSTYRDMNDAPRALKAFHQAIDAGKDTKNLTLLGQTYGQMGALLARHDLYDDALEAHKKSLNLYEKQEERSRIPLVLRNIARIYDVKEMNDSAVLYYQQALQMSKKHGNAKTSDNIKSELGCLYYEMGKIHKAKQTLDGLTGHPSVISNALLYLGIIYKELSQQDSAHHFLNQALKYGDLSKQCSAHKYLWQIEEENGNGEKARMHKELHILLADSIQAMKQKETAGTAHSRLNYKRLEKDYRSLYKERTSLYNHLIASWVLLIAICTITLVAGLFLLKRKRKKYSVPKDIQTSIAKTEVFLYFQQASKSGCIISETKWAELQKEIKTHFPEYYTHLSEKEFSDKLSLHEVRICHLTKLKFTNRAMANILHVTESAISHAKIRMYKRITNQKGTSAKFLDFIESL